jgi:hypothetical protein
VPSGTGCPVASSTYTAVFSIGVPTGTDGMRSSTSAVTSWCVVSSEVSVMPHMFSSRTSGSRRRNSPAAPGFSVSPLEATQRSANGGNASTP